VAIWPKSKALKPLGDGLVQKWPKAPHSENWKFCIMCCMPWKLSRGISGSSGEWTI
jgi:hypothetical protein